VLAGVLLLASLTSQTGFAKEKESDKNTLGTKIPVKLIACGADASTAIFSMVGPTRLIYVNTPEAQYEVEAYGKQAATYTCSILTSAKKIEVQFDGPKNKRIDANNRHLAWIFVDGKLLQLLLVQKGYVDKFFDYGDYAYEDSLANAMEDAKRKKIGVWAKKPLKLPTPKPKENERKD
jgi:micrococcal nuclease